MNNRIKELAREAAEITDGKLECWGEFHEDYAFTWNETFVELIVQECIEIVQPESYDGDAMTASLNAKVKQIKEHFGVE